MWLSTDACISAVVTMRIERADLSARQTFPSCSSTFYPYYCKPTVQCVWKQLVNNCDKEDRTISQMYSFLSCYSTFYPNCFHANWSTGLSNTQERTDDTGNLYSRSEAKAFSFFMNGNTERAQWALSRVGIPRKRKRKAMKRIKQKYKISNNGNKKNHAIRSLRWW